MKINLRQRGSVLIIDLEGRLCIGEGETRLRTAIYEILHAGAKAIVINFASVTETDASGIGELVAAHTTAANRGATLKLINLPDKTHDILTITQLITVFSVYDNEEEAVASFA